MLRRLVVGLWVRQGAEDPIDIAVEKPRRYSKPFPLERIDQRFTSTPMELGERASTPGCSPARHKRKGISASADRREATSSSKLSGPLSRRHFNAARVTVPGPEFFRSPRSRLLVVAATQIVYVRAFLATSPLLGHIRNTSCLVATKTAATVARKYSSQTVRSASARP